MSIRSSAWWRAPGTGVDVTIAMNASALSWSKLRPLSGLAFSAATAASNAADNRASASGSRLIWVWHMPSRSIQRRTVRCDSQLLVVAQALVARDAAGQVADLAGERVHRRRRGLLDQARRLRRQLDAFLLVETVRRSGDRIGVTR